MNILFLSLSSFQTKEANGIYPDLLRVFDRHGHNVYVFSPVMTRKEEGEVREGAFTIFMVKTGRIRKTNLLEKGINTLLIERRFINAIKKHLTDVKFDLVLYPTPPITFVNVVHYIRKRDGAKTYLMLKDIFPQGAVDAGMMRKDGLLYRFFRTKEKKLYSISDRIGCMSQANIEYLQRNNPQVPKKKIEICPNSIEVRDLRISREERTDIRKRYGLPLEKTVFVCGGNFGIGQGILFLTECLKAEFANKDVFFLFIGSGTEFGKLENFFRQNSPSNMKLMKGISKDEYDQMAAACDVGLIFLDHRSTIPNFPSRILSYMQARLPVLACTDPVTDIGQIITAGNFGWWCESNDVNAFVETVQICLAADREAMGEKGYQYLQNHYTVQKSYEIIMRSINEIQKA